MNLHEFIYIYIWGQKLWKTEIKFSNAIFNNPSYVLN
jgi:hypothetical protein